MVLLKGSLKIIPLSPQTKLLPQFAAGFLFYTGHSFLRSSDGSVLEIL
jgi:hypothetical protein